MLVLVTVMRRISTVAASDGLVMSRVTLFSARDDT